MSNSYVGAGILNVITESLYDNPIVVFREYVQNSMDSILREYDTGNREIKIWFCENNLYFLDNGSGIATENFFDEMRTIGGSGKKRQKDIGYKGIGRLSGVPYCRKLYFLNIEDYSNKEIQLYTISGELYEKIKNNQLDSEMSFHKLMDEIGECIPSFDLEKNEMISNAIDKYEKMLTESNSGFLVILNDISSVLENTINDNDFFTNLQWLLPVDFDKDLYCSEEKELFEELTTKNDENGNTPIKFCKISYNDKNIYRPIKKSFFRDYVCKNNFKYAVGFHSFNGNKIYIDKNNDFTGIRIYIDNMLLCDENELLQNLDNYGLLSHTLNGQLQSVRGIGAMIYINDKVNISANARRTFIEVTDDDSLEFLNLLAEFVNTIYDTRYALSNYASAKDKQDQSIEKLQKLRIYALNCLRKLAKEEIKLTVDDEYSKFDDLSVIDKKKVFKKKISKKINDKIKEYLKTITTFNAESVYKDFIEWLSKNQ